MDTFWCTFLSPWLPRKISGWGWFWAKLTLLPEPWFCWVRPDYFPRPRPVSIFGRGLRSRRTGLEKTSQHCLDVQGSNCSIWNVANGNSNKIEALESWSYVRCRAGSQDSQRLRCLWGGVLQSLFSEVCCKGAGGFDCLLNGRGSISSFEGELVNRVTPPNGESMPW